MHVIVLTSRLTGPWFTDIWWTRHVGLVSPASCPFSSLVMTLPVHSKHKLFNEATRIITMTLTITHTEPSEPPFEHRPRLHFKGFSVANDTMISGVHGFVCMTASGYVRWHLVSLQRVTTLATLLTCPLIR
jgi:hypothetical protein